MWPLEFTATPDTSPRYILLGSFSKSETESKAICGMVCAVADTAKAATIANAPIIFPRIQASFAAQHWVARVRACQWRDMTDAILPSIVGCGSRETTMRLVMALLSVAFGSAAVAQTQAPAGQ